MSDNVPPGIVLNILTRLPVKSLLRFRCVCKSWLSAIDSPNFVNLHLYRSISTKSNTCIVAKQHYNALTAYALDGAVSLDEETAVDFKTLTPDFVKKFALGDVVGSVNGVVCLSLLDGFELVMWNPSTRNYLKVPPVSTDVSRGFVRTARVVPSYGFGYDYAGKDFKVVRMEMTWRVAARNSDDAFPLWDVKVFSLKTMSWTKKRGFPHPMRYERETGKFAGGCLNWCLTPCSHPFQRPQDQENLIMSLDLATEEYEVFAQPVFPKKVFRTSLTALEGRLALVCDYQLGYIDVWVMKEHGVRDSWTRLVSVDLCDFVRPVAYSKGGGQVLLEKNWGSLVWLDLESKKVKESGIRAAPKFFQESFIYVESLIQLPNLGEAGLKYQKKMEEGNTKTRMEASC